MEYMNILVISASMRAESQSLKVSNWLAEHLKTIGAKPELLDLHAFKLPFFDDGETVAENADELRQILSNTEGYVFVSPEWNGMMSHGLLNMLHYVSTEMSHKPVMLTGVSSGRGGAYPISQMRIAGHKTTRYFISPETLRIQGVKETLNDHDMSETTADFAVKIRADYALKILVEYAKVAKDVRSSGVVDAETFPTGI